jgi:hypothetical protein
VFQQIVDFTNSVTRPLTTTALVATTCYLAITEAIEPVAFLPIVFLVLNWWFEERAEEKRIKAVAAGQAAGTQQP